MIIRSTGLCPGKAVPSLGGAPGRARLPDWTAPTACSAAWALYRTIQSENLWLHRHTGKSLVGAN